jgi:hypothetical protein
MVEKAASRTRLQGLSVLEHPDLDQTIVRIVSDKGDATFATILNGAKERFTVSRETVARRLARLLRFSQIVRLRHGHYAVGSLSTPPTTILRMRSVSVTEVISPDGSARYQFEKEFLVLSGRCDHITSQVEPSTRMPARGLDVKGSRRVRMTTFNDGGRTTMIARFIPAIPAGPWIPHRLLLSFACRPRFYAMQQGSESPAEPPSSRIPRNRHEIGVLSNPEPGTIVETSKETILDLRVHFPRGFPRGPIHPRVAAIPSSRALDREARSLVELSKKTRGALGLAVYDDLVTVRVKNPLIDCFYGFTWTPPKADAYAGWVHRLVAKGRGRATKFVS